MYAIVKDTAKHMCCHKGCYLSYRHIVLLRSSLSLPEQKQSCTQMPLLAKWDFHFYTLGGSLAQNGGPQGCFSKELKHDCPVTIMLFNKVPQCRPPYAILPGSLLQPCCPLGSLSSGFCRQGSLALSLHNLYMFKPLEFDLLLSALFT